MQSLYNVLGIFMNNNKDNKIKYRFINLPIVKRGKESKIETVGVPITR